MINASIYPAVPQGLGFSITSTGGGCTAWIKTFPNGCHILITDGDLGDDLATAEIIEVAAYNADSEMLGTGPDDYWCGDFGGLLPAIERFTAMCL